MPAIEIDPQTAGASISDDRLATIESSLGVRFPVEFIESLRAANGGVPLARHFIHEGDEMEIDRVLSVISDYKNDPLGQYDIEVVWSQIEDRLNEFLVPFAALPNGDFLCFDFEANERQPSIVRWDHERSRTGDPAVSQVSASFEEFTAILRS